MRFQQINLWFILLVSLEVMAKDVVILKGTGVYKLVIPESFEYHPQFFGLENVIMSKRDPEMGTSSLSITITGLEGSNFNTQELAGSQKDYQAGRRKYLQERRLELLEFIPYALKKSPQNYQIHTIGVIYTNGQSITVDRSFMIECPKSFIHAKIIGDVGHLKNLKDIKNKFFKRQTLSELEKSILEISCQNKN